ncbi:MAG: hypothetical protein LBJ00_18230 [Planctomycetaceae bacterium]|nr:hypothetical protein [Planctomycetaceae bacterium]
MSRFHVATSIGDKFCLYINEPVFCSTLRLLLNSRSLTRKRNNMKRLLKGEAYCLYWLRYI